LKIDPSFAQKAVKTLHFDLDGAVFKISYYRDKIISLRRL